MAATPETGFLILADLTGYTAYLSGSEIEHAPVIAGDLLETIVGRLDPPFRLSKFEGDAGFLFVEDGRAEGSLLLDAIEASYLAFRRRLRSIDAATSCDCNSCRLAPRLDLKLFIHHGSYVHSRIAGRDELAGRDVILVHRLLKGRVAADGTSGRVRGTHRCGRERHGDRAGQPGPCERRGVVRAPRSRRGLRVGPGGTLAGRERPTTRRRRRRRDPRRQRHAGCRVGDGLGLSDRAGPPKPVGGSARRGRGLGRRQTRGRDRLPVHHGPPRDDRGDHRLATLRPHRLAAGGTRHRPGPGDGGPGRPSMAARDARSGGRSIGCRQPTRSSSRGSWKRSGPPWIRLEHVLAGDVGAIAAAQEAGR